MTAPTADAPTPQRPVVPSGRAGWWHDYVCHTHGTELVHDPDRVEGEPHLCPHGCRLSGAELDGAWRVLSHQACARTLRTSARRYLRTGDAGDRALAVGLVHDYVEVYREVLAAGWSSSSQEWMLRGKLFSQALTESIWGVAVADGVLALATGSVVHGHDAADLQPARDLLTPLSETVHAARRTLVEERGELRNNYTAWLDAAGALFARASSALGDEAADLEQWQEGPHGLHAFLEAAVGDDGWEWEGSTYYHLFVLRACLLGLGGSAPRSLPEPVADRLERMLAVLVGLATEAGVLPVLHDGPYARVPAQQELLEVAVLGRQLVDLPGLDRLEAHARAALTPAGTGLEDELDGWFDGPPRAAREPRPARSVHWPEAGFLVLRPPSGRWQAVVDAGPHGGSHGHHDKLGLYLYGREEQWQPAPGVPPYASHLRLQHYARTLAHPTVRVDDADQAPCTGRVARWETTERGARASVAADDAYDGVRLERHLEMTERYLLDAVLVRAETPRTLDLGLRPAAGIAVQGGADHWRTTWGSGAQEGSELVALHVASGPSAFRVVPGRGPSDDPARVLPVVDWHAEGDQVWFVSAYQPADDPHGPRSVQVRTTPEGLTVEVGLGDGTTETHRLHPLPPTTPGTATPTTPAEDPQ